jgi:hypothetical protein
MAAWLQWIMAAFKNTRFNQTSYLRANILTFLQIMYNIFAVKIRIFVLLVVPVIYSA